MSDDHPNSGDPAGPRRRPPPPTIDLTATEVSPAAGADQGGQDVAGADKPPGNAQDSPDAAGPQTASPESGSAAGMAAEGSEAGPVPPESPQSSSPDGEEPRGQDSVPPRRKGNFAYLIRGIPWAALGGGVAGAMIVLLLAAGLRSMFGQPSDGDLDERLTHVESRLNDLAARRAAPNGGATALSDLAARVARLEHAPVSTRGPDAAVGNRLSTLEASTKSLADGVADLNRRTDETVAALRDLRGRVDDVAKKASNLARQAASPQPGQAPEVTRADLDQLGQRLAAVEAATASLKHAVGQVSSQPPEVTRADLDRLGGRIAALEDATASLQQAAGRERATRVAVLALALDGVAERGTPYAAELAAARALVPDSKALDPLQPFAASGVPSLAALARELVAIKLPRAQAPAQPAPAGFLDRLQANAERLVRIRPVSEPQGDEPAAILARMHAKVAEGDVAGAIADAAKLPADARAAVDGWAKRAAARQAALAAAQRFSADSLAALGRGASQGDQHK